MMTNTETQTILSQEEGDAMKQLEKEILTNEEAERIVAEAWESAILEDQAVASFLRRVLDSLRLATALIRIKAVS